MTGYAKGKSSWHWRIVHPLSGSRLHRRKHTFALASSGGACWLRYRNTRQRGREGLQRIVAALEAVRPAAYTYCSCMEAAMCSRSHRAMHAQQLGAQALGGEMSSLKFSLAGVELGSSRGSTS